MSNLHHAILETLESRTLLTTVYWNAGSGDWDDTSLNWNTLANGQLALIGTWSGPAGTDTYAPNFAHYLTQIQTAIATNSTALGITDNPGVTTVNLSSFTDYSALLT
jgi:hypothetical protein